MNDKLESANPKHSVGNLDVNTIRKHLKNIIQPLDNSSLVRRLNIWDWAHLQIIKWMLAERDAGREVPDKEIPDMCNSDEFSSEVHLQVCAKSVLNFLTRMGL